jgi:hypothetical protein
MSFYYLAYIIRQPFSKTVAPKPQALPQVPPVLPPSSDKDKEDYKEDYKEEFEPKPEYGKDFYMSFLIW